MVTPPAHTSPMVRAMKRFLRAHARHPDTALLPFVLAEPDDANTAAICAHNATMRTENTTVRTANTNDSAGAGIPSAASVHAPTAPSRPQPTGAAALAGLLPALAPGGSTVVALDALLNVHAPAGLTPSAAEAAGARAAAGARRAAARHAAAAQPQEASVPRHQQAQDVNPAAIAQGWEAEKNERVAAMFAAIIADAASVAVELLDANAESDEEEVAHTGTDVSGGESAHPSEMSGHESYDDCAVVADSDEDCVEAVFTPSEVESGSHSPAEDANASHSANDAGEDGFATRQDDSSHYNDYGSDNDGHVAGGLDPTCATAAEDDPAREHEHDTGGLESEHASRSTRESEGDRASFADNMDASGNASADDSGSSSTTDAEVDDVSSDRDSPSASASASTSHSDHDTDRSRASARDGESASASESDGDTDNGSDSNYARYLSFTARATQRVKARIARALPAARAAAALARASAAADSSTASLTTLAAGSGFTGSGSDPNPDADLVSAEAADAADAMTSLRFATLCFGTAMAQPLFLALPRAALRRFLRSSELNCGSEFALLQAVVRWGRFRLRAYGLDDTDPALVRLELHDLLPLIRFGAMTADQIAIVTQGGALAEDFDAALFRRCRATDVIRMPAEYIACADHVTFNYTTQPPSSLPPPSSESTTGGGGGGGAAAATVKPPASGPTESMK